MQNIKVENMENSNGNLVNNQFIITETTPEGKRSITFQSYKSVIAIKEGGKVWLDRYYWDYSVTTGKYRNIFLGETKKETELKIKSGEYKLVNLN